ncbi:MAG TPA: hypothetical protein VG889_06650 [Rhizomicrobium sp.]|nr:hypothetical protein [Rhizomicrobium sp.]
MSNSLPSPPPEPLDVGTLASWLGGGLALFGGLEAIGLGYLGVGLTLLAGAVAAFPPFHRAIAAILGVAIPGWIRLGVFVVTAFAAGSLLPPGALTPPAPAPSEPLKPVAPKPATPAPQQPAATQPLPGPKVLLDIRGAGTKSTERFATTGSDWDLHWSYDCTGIGMTSNFIVRVVGDDGPTTMGVNQYGGGGEEDTDHFHQGGTFYLEVASGCRWHIVATDAR